MAATPVPASLLAGLALAALAAPAAAADLVVGGPQGFPTIQAAIDAAAPGDRVFVLAGNYAPFHLTKPIEVRGASAVSVRVLSGLAPTGAVPTVSGIPAGAVATLQQISFDFSTPGLPTNHPVLVVEDNEGTVVLDGVRVNTQPGEGHFGAGLGATDTVRLVVQGCDLRGSIGSSQFGGSGFPAVDAARTTLWISGSRLLASDHAPYEFSFLVEGPPGLRVTDGAAHLARTECAGGTGSPDAFTPLPAPGGPGVDLSGASLVLTGGPGNVLRGAQGGAVFGGPSPAPGGAGLRLSGGSTAALAADAVLVGGLDGSGTVAAPPLVVAAGSTATALPHRRPALAHATAPLALGGGFLLEHTGEPGAVVVPFVAAALGPDLVLPALDGVVLLDLAAPAALPAVVLGRSGAGASSGTVPNDPAFAGAHAWVQAAEATALAVRLSNPWRLAIER